MNLGSWLGSLALTACAVALGVAACDYPEFQFGPGTGGGGTGTGTNTGTGTGTGTGTTGPTGGGGAGGTGTGTDTGTATTTTTTGAGGTGGTEPTPCTTLGEQAECGAGRKCSVADPAAGTIGCVDAGATPDFAVCSANSDCGVSSWCDDPTGVCRPICQNAGTCTGLYNLPSGALCVGTKQGGQTVLGGLLVCSAHCNPLNPYQCNQATGGVTCGRRTDFIQDWDCLASGGVGHNSGCGQTRDCNPGLACGGDGTCQPWCNAPDGCCGSCILCGCNPCNVFPSPLDYDGTALGACYQSPTEVLLPRDCC